MVRFDGYGSSPYFQIFNPTGQSQRFDLDGTFIRRLVPALRDVPTASIDDPSREPLWLARTRYPATCVDYRERRAESLARLSRVGRSKPPMK